MKMGVRNILLVCWVIKIQIQHGLIGKSYLKKKIDNKTFHYRKNELVYVEKKVKDTIFYYDNDRLDSPDSYVIKKGNKIIEEVDYFLNTKEITIERRNNKQGDIIYLVVESAYLPSEFDKKRLSEMEIAKEQVERCKMKIFEYEYEYY